MNPVKKITWLIHLTAGLLASTVALAADAPTNDSLAEAFRDEPSHSIPSTPEPMATAPNQDKGLRLNFHGVPLEMVLNYLSQAAGFIIDLHTDVKGKVDVWSDQSLNKEEAVGLLNAALNKNGFAAIQNGRTLTIINRDEARRENIPVKKGNNPDNIPSNAEIVTQVIPVRSLNVMQLPKDLAPLLSTNATLNANESGNSLLMTDTQANIRRITKIISALDSVSSSVNSIRVFPLKYADAKALADIVKELFPPPDSARPDNNPGNPGRFRGNGGNRGGGGNFAAMAAMMSGGGFGGENPPGGEGGANAGDSGRTPVTHVSAVADDHSNSLIISAPDTLMPTIEQLVTSLDSSSQDITEVRVFHLQNADPTEMVDLLNGLFSDDNTSSDAIRSASQFAFSGFRGPFGGGFGRLATLASTANNNSSEPSDRMKRMGHVVTVADVRTSSIVVSAAKDLMPQIDSMIGQLDASPARRQNMHIVSLANADPYDVLQILNDVVAPNPLLKNNSANTTTQNNALLNRANTFSQSQNSAQATTTANNFNTTPGGGR